MARRVRTRGHFAPIAWIGGAASALLLVLGVNGTLAAWTTAIITNDTNTVAAANAVILKETSGATTCNSTDGAQTTVNVYTCSTINKYGGTASPLSPNGTQSVSVTMQNTGTESGALTISAGTCTASGGQSATNSVCGQMQVKLECPSGTTTVFATGSLSSFNTTTGASPASVGTLAAGASVVCTFTVSLPASTSPIYAGQTASQPLTWTLTGA